MDPFYAFLAFALILALDLFSTQGWLAVYYRFGIPVYFSRKPLETGGAELDPAALAKALEQALRERPGVPTLRFKVIAARPGGRASGFAAIAYHPVFFDARGGGRYLPVTHSLVRLHVGQGWLSMAGYLNWYVLFVLVYLVFRTMSDLTFIFVDVIILLIFGLSYIAQAAINGMIANQIHILLAKGSSEEAK